MTGQIAKHVDGGITILLVHAHAARLVAAAVNLDGNDLLREAGVARCEGQCPAIGITSQLHVEGVVQARRIAAKQCDEAVEQDPQLRRTLQ